MSCPYSRLPGNTREGGCFLDCDGEIAILDIRILLLVLTNEPESLYLKYSAGTIKSQILALFISTGLKKPRRPRDTLESQLSITYISLHVL